jgi:uncharacterized protein with GYD domain
MAKYLVYANYKGEGVKGLMKEGGSGRRDAVRKMIESVGGKLESIYYAFGDNDIYVIADLPDNQAAMAVSLITNSSGAVAVHTAVLMTPEEVDEAVKRTPSYRAPGA